MPTGKRFLRQIDSTRHMLLDMEQRAQANASANSANFAGLLASLMSPAAKKRDDEAEWPSGELGDDVVTLSYENALRAHSRYRTGIRGGWGSEAGLEPGDAGKLPAAAVKERETFTPAAGVSAKPATNDRDLRSASVTVRLSAAESERLRVRAAETGLTVSAYLRSCTFEVEALRAQVKNALAELKATAQKEQAPLAEHRGLWGLLGWFASLLRRCRNSERLAGA